ncbi:MAG: ATP synthase F0 subunit B [Myxococcales bacterium]|nr:ATP synthase F0 subunit B [Myxococcales bacterium]
MRERDRWNGPLTRTTAITAAMLLASSARATEGLVLEPDFRVTLPLLIVVFLLLIFPVNHLIFRPIFRVLEARKDRIEGNRARAAALSQQAEEVVARYERSLREVREDAEDDRRARLEVVRSETARGTAEVRAGAEREMAGAREEVTAALEQARAGLRAQAEELANEAAGRILGRPLS